MTTKTTIDQHWRVEALDGGLLHQGSAMATHELAQETAAKGVACRRVRVKITTERFEAGEYPQAENA